MTHVASSSKDPKPETNGKSTARVLSQFDCICIIVGTIIGSGIFRMPSVVASNVPNVFWMVCVWVLGGVIALIGALCFAELTTTYPDRGGDYGYLKRAFHRRIGFAFSWAAFWVIRPTNIGAMAVIFGEFFARAVPGTLTPFLSAVAVVVVISGTNLLGVVFGKTTQNVLTVAKVLGMLLIVVAAVMANSDADSKAIAIQDSNAIAAVSFQADASSENKPTDLNVEPESDTPSELDENRLEWFWLSMVFVMFTFGGWSDIAFVASEVREPKRNLLRSLVIGTMVVLAVYLIVNLSLVFGIGFDRMAELGGRWESASAAMVGDSMGAMGLRVFAALVCVSCLGGINGMIFTSPRIYWATAVDYPALNWMTAGQGGWRAMTLQAAVTLLFIGVFGRNKSGFDYIVVSSAPYFWLFLALTVVALMVCRVRCKGQFTGYRVPLYPLLPLIFVSACGFMVFRSWVYMAEQKLLVPAILIAVWVLFGVVLSFALNKQDGNSPKN